VLGEEHATVLGKEVWRIVERADDRFAVGDGQRWHTFGSRS